VCLRRLRPIATLALVACLAFAAAGWPSTGEPPAGAQPPLSAEPEIAPAGPTYTARDVAWLAEQGRIALRRRRKADRRAQLRRLRRSRTVKGTLRRALLAGTLNASTHRRLRRIWWTSNRAGRRLHRPEARRAAGRSA